MPKNKEIHHQHLVNEFFIFSYLKYLPLILIFSYWVAPLVLSGNDLKLLVQYDRAVVALGISFMAILDLNVNYGCNPFERHYKTFKGAFYTTKTLSILLGGGGAGTGFVFCLSLENKNITSTTVARFVPTDARQWMQKTFFFTEGIGGACSSRDFAARSLMVLMGAANPAQDFISMRKDNSFDVDPIKVAQVLKLSYDVKILESGERVLTLKDTVDINNLENKWTEAARDTDSKNLGVKPKVTNFIPKFFEHGTFSKLPKFHLDFENRWYPVREDQAPLCGKKALPPLKIFAIEGLTKKP